MNLPDAHRAILTECLLRQRMLPKKAPPLGGYMGSYDERLSQARADAAVARQVEHGPAWSSVGWFGAADAASQKRYSRALRDLEAAGLIVVTAVSAQRAGWVKLTAEGERVALELAAGAKEESTGEAPTVPASAAAPGRRKGPKASFVGPRQ